MDPFSGNWEIKACVHFCWVTSYCDTEDNERLDKAVDENLYLDWLANTYLKPLINCYIQPVIQIKWDVFLHGTDLYLWELTLASARHKKFHYQSWGGCKYSILPGHTEAKNVNIMSRWHKTTCVILVKHWPLTTYEAETKTVLTQKKSLMAHTILSICTAQIAPILASQVVLGTYKSS